MIIQDAATTAYLATFERPLGILTQRRLEQWSFLQELGYAGALAYLQTHFHGLDDFYDQMELYSSTHPVLSTAWKTIKELAPLNLDVLKETATIPPLGLVGDEFLTVPELGLAFAISPDQLSTVSGVKDACTGGTEGLS